MRPAMVFAAFVGWTACDSPTPPLAPTIRRALLTFTPATGGESVTFVWSDQVGTQPESTDDILLELDTAYTLTLAFVDTAVEPAADLTPEIASIPEEYQLFFTGTAIEGPATSDNRFAVARHAYDDVDRLGHPIGLANTVDTTAEGSGGLTVTIRHMPRENELFVKEAGFAETVATDGFDGLPGETDLEVEFLLRVE